MANITTSGNGQLRCFDTRAPQVGPPLFVNGQIHFQSYYIGWIVTGVFTLIASAVSFWLINKHLQWYTNKKEQRYIVRILFLVPLYAVISFASYLFWNHATPLVLIRDCYEAFVLTAFFYLLLLYVSPDPEEQKQVFVKVGISHDHDLRRQRKGLPPKKWLLPLGSVKRKPADGLYFLQMMKWGVLQYCVIRPTSTLAAVILNYVGLYCESSWSPSWAHLYLTSIVSLSVTIAMYCLIQLYVTVSKPIKHHKPLIKMLAIKTVVFLTFWQSTFLSLLTVFGVVKDTPYMTASNINVGIGAIVECVEMTIFAFVHVKCFSYKPYVPEPVGFYGNMDDQHTSRLRSLGHVLNFKETFMELKDGCIHLFRRAKGQETDMMIRRTMIMEGAFGRPRITAQPVVKKSLDEKLDFVAVNVEVQEMNHVGGERQWLGLGDDYGYSLGYLPQEKSDCLEDQIEELTIRGYRGKEQIQVHSSAPEGDAEQGHQHGRSLWLRNIYDRISQSGPDESFTPAPKRKSWLRPQDKDKHVRPLMNQTYDDPPPASRLQTYRSSKLIEKGYDSELPSKLKVGNHTPDLSNPRAGPVAQTSGLPSRPENSPHTVQSDSIFSRVFIDDLRSPDVDSSNEFGSSSYSHRTHVRLAGEPTILPKTVKQAKVANITEAPGRVVGRRAHSQRRSRHVTTLPYSAEPLLHSRVREWRTESTRLLAPLELEVTSLQGIPELTTPSLARSRAPPRGSPHGLSNRRSPVPPPLPPKPSFRPPRDQLTIPAPLASSKEVAKSSNDIDQFVPHNVRRNSVPPRFSRIFPPNRSNAIRRGHVDPLRGLRKYSLEPPSR